MNAFQFRRPASGSPTTVTCQVLEKLKFWKLRVQKPEPPVLLCSGGQSTNPGAAHIATAAGDPRAARVLSLAFILHDPAPALSSATSFFFPKPKPSIARFLLLPAAIRLLR